ncbi:MAG: aminotransferase class V-fold PLP-dependent enzyme [Gemmatimonadota bacterium]|nr:aminotransferase class V-fold PLP-dependent enzyme [Gemmatimonadota bacterium]
MSTATTPHDPDGLLEYSVVYTDRALNHMSVTFQDVMRDISGTLRDVYAASAVAVVPGSGTFGMEAVARQLATGRRCLVIRNGWFSYRWSQILDVGSIPETHTVLKARPTGPGSEAPFAPPPLDDVVSRIREERPAVVFAPHVETSSGMMLPDAYLSAVAEAVHEVGGLFVLDCIASGTVWVDMTALGVDVLVSAPQKGWSAPPSSALVMLGDRALERMTATESTSFACDLKRWHQIMRAYEEGGHAYHATMPTDALRAFRDAMRETVGLGLDVARNRQLELGRRVRSLLEARGYKSVAAKDFQAPGVVVSYTDDPAIQSGRAFAEQGMQIAAGVPLKCDEPDDFSTFRLGLFGLDKLTDVDGAVTALEHVLDRLG